MRVLQTTTEIILPPNFVVVHSNLTVYYVFNATNTTNSTDNGTNVTNGTDTIPDATGSTDQPATTPTPDTTTPTPDATIPTPDATTPTPDATTPTPDATTPTPDATIPTVSTDNTTAPATIDLYLVFQGHHWFGLGFGTQMAGSDMIITEIVNDAIVVTDRYSPDHVPPELDINQGGTSDITLVESTMNETTIVVHVKRLQNTTDPLDFVFTGPGTYSWIWAYNPELTATFHDLGGNKGITMVTLVDTTVPATTTTEATNVGAETTTTTLPDATTEPAAGGDGGL
jgi:hypothetical protein